MNNTYKRLLDLVVNNRTDEQSALSRKDYDRNDHRYGGDQIVRAKGVRDKLAKAMLGKPKGASRRKVRREAAVTDRHFGAGYKAAMKM